jgi:PUB domain/UBX domain
MTTTAVPVVHDYYVDLKEAAAYILSHNFDSVTQPCFITILKLLDNVVAKPHEPLVRRIKFSNAAIAAKIGNCQGGVEFLTACGFTPQEASTGGGVAAVSWNSESSATIVASSPPLPSLILVLEPERENLERLVTARRLLETHLLQDLKCDESDVPRFRPPPTPQPIVLTSDPTMKEAPSSSNTTMNTAAAAVAPAAAAAAAAVVFNPYQGQRYDALSAAVGASLGPDANYTSPTLAELHRLQARREQLQQQLMQNDLTMNRQWTVTLPGGMTAPALSTATAAAAAAAANVPVVAASFDASLLAARAQAQYQERVQRETGGFTTAAMRQVQRLSRQRVYAHVLLSIIAGPDGTKLSGQFRPDETIGTVMSALQRDCFARASSTNNDHDLEFDLYVTPPRRLLLPHQTLTEAGLVPAAKIFLSWKGWAAEALRSSDCGTAAWISDHLLPSNDNASSTTTREALAFPASVPVVAPPSSSAAVASAMDVDQDSKPAAKKLSKEEQLLRRMMGGTSSSGSGNAGSNNLGGGKGAAPKKPSGQPKWFKR